MQERIEKLIKHELLPVIAAKDVAIMADWDSLKNQKALRTHFDILKKCTLPHIQDDEAIDETVDLFAFRIAADILRGQGHFSEEIVRASIDKAWGIARKFNRTVF